MVASVAAFDVARDRYSRYDENERLGGHAEAGVGAKLDEGTSEARENNHSTKAAGRIAHQPAHPLAATPHEALREQQQQEDDANQGAERSFNEPDQFDRPVGTG